MKYGIMRFCDFAIHHNPHTIIVKDSAEKRKVNALSGDETIYGCNKNSMLVSGKGVFYGENAFEQYLELRELYKNKKCGLLSVGGLNPFTACMSRLEFECKPNDDYIEYSFEFVEAESPFTENSTKPEFTIVQDGEDLWDIAYRKGIDIDEIMKLNPQLKSTNDLTNGTLIKLS